MSTVKLSADEIRSRARANRTMIAATTEGDIACHAVEDETRTDDVDLNAALADGRLRASDRDPESVMRALQG